MINPNFFLGYPVAFKEICWVYPPKLKDIVADQNYPMYRKLLLITQEEIEDLFAEAKISFEELPTPFQYLFLMSAANEELKELIIKGFQFFLHEPVLLLPDIGRIIVGDLKETLESVHSIDALRILTEENYFELQNLIRCSIGEKEAEPYNPNENPKIKYFKAKARLRDKVKAKSNTVLNLGSTMAAFCCMNFGINPLNIGELSQSALTVLMRYYQEKTKYDNDIAFLLAGADSKKIQPQNWIRNIEDL